MHEPSEERSQGSLVSYQEPEVCRGASREPPQHSAALQNLTEASRRGFDGLFAGFPVVRRLSAEAVGVDGEVSQLFQLLEGAVERAAVGSVAEGAADVGLGEGGGELGEGGEDIGVELSGAL